MYPATLLEKGSVMRLKFAIFLTIIGFSFANPLPTMATDVKIATNSPVGGADDFHIIFLRSQGHICLTGICRDDIVSDPWGLQNNSPDDNNYFGFTWAGPSLTENAPLTFDIGISSASVNLNNYIQDAWWTRMGERITTLPLDFYVVRSSIPEPPTWALMLTGVGVVAVAMRFRRRKGDRGSLKSAAIAPECAIFRDQ
jgi:hypothetical protein